MMLPRIYNFYSFEAVLLVIIGNLTKLIMASTTLRGNIKWHKNDIGGYDKTLNYF